MALWGSRFSSKPSELMYRFNESISVDIRLAIHDVNNSIAYVASLEAASIITADQAQILTEGLESVRHEHENGRFTVQNDEDIHSANERRLREFVGSVAGCVHTARSRNDQVATDLRMWIRESGDQCFNVCKELINVLVTRAESDQSLMMAGYTHLQRAQPIRWSHLLLSYAWYLVADLEKLQSLVFSTTSPSSSAFCSLGAGALAGNPFVDREKLAKSLGFAHPLMNSLHAVGDRDLVCDFMYWCNMVMIHLSRICEDLIIYSSKEFGFVSLHDSYSTGSSLMPQKKNPDSLELIRGKVGRVFGNLSGFLMTYKGQPSTYNKDLQEDKPPLFDSFDQTVISMEVMTQVIKTLSTSTAAMNQSLSSDLVATDLSEYMVVHTDVDFRSAHGIVGKAVRMAEASGRDLPQLTRQEWIEISDGRFTATEIENASEWWKCEASIERRNGVGGTALCSIVAQIQALRLQLETLSTSHDSLKSK